MRSAGNATPGNATLRGGEGGEEGAGMEAGDPGGGVEEKSATTEGGVPGMEGAGMESAEIKSARMEPGVPGEKSATTEGGVPGMEAGVPGGGVDEKSATTEGGVPGDVPGGVPGTYRWFSRGYLPHVDGEELIQHVTFHLADSLPRDVVERLDRESKALPAEKQDAERRKKIEAWMDAGHGSCVLRDPSIAQMVESTLLHFNLERYQLFAWVVMPNHVHVLFMPINGWKLETIVGSWKSFTGKGIADRRHHGGWGSEEKRQDGAWRSRVWHREYYDRYIRNEAHFETVVEYIHNNPVKAGLVSHPEEWQWSSATPGNATLRGGAEEETT